MKTFFSIVLAVALSLSTALAKHGGRGGHGGQADTADIKPNTASILAQGRREADVANRANTLAQGRREADTNSAEAGRNSAAANR